MVTLDGAMEEAWWRAEWQRGCESDGGLSWQAPMVAAARACPV